MAESRLQRWSRQKTEARKETDHTAPLPVDAGPASEEQELAINETLSEQDILRKYDLPAPETIELGTDITGFMGKEIPEFLRRKALRSLWRSNPVLAVLDGLNDYDEDFTTAATATNGVKTLYRVGEGFIDRTAGRDAGINTSAGEDANREDSVRPPGAADESTGSESEGSQESLTASAHDHLQAEESDAEAAPTQRYRPRMRFTS